MVSSRTYMLYICDLLFFGSLCALATFLKKKNGFQNAAPIDTISFQGNISRVPCDSPLQSIVLNF